MGNALDRARAAQHDDNTPCCIFNYRLNISILLYIHGVLSSCCIHSRSSRKKAGAGKPRSPLTLAVAVEQASRTAVVLDIDSQATACKWSARRAAETPLVLAVQPARLPGALATAAAHDVDVVVIDTSARSEHAALEAARVADLVVIPCRPQLYDLETIPGDAAGVVACGRRVRRRCSVGGGCPRPTD